MKKKNDKHPEKNTENSPDNFPDKTPGIILDNLQGKKPGIAAILLALVILGGALILGAYLLNIIPSAHGPETGSGNVTVYYFYGTECPHCHNVTPYIESLRDKHPDVSFQILEIWHNDTNGALHKLLNHKLGLEATGVPQVIVGNVSLLGEDKIHAGLEKAILAQKGNLTGSSQVGAVPFYGPSAGSDATIHATYFYGNGCSHCEAIKPLLTDLGARYPDLRIEMLEIN
jgi:thiol-disulfide isomerase/thioredoxin